MIELPVLSEARVKKPSWLKVKLPTGENYRKVRQLVDEYKLHTILFRIKCSPKNPVIMNQLPTKKLGS